MITATSATTAKEKLPPGRPYRWRDPSRVHDPEAAEKLQRDLDRAAGYHPEWEWAPGRQPAGAAVRPAAIPPVTAAAEIPATAAPPRRCGVCRYLAGSIGHKVNCGN